MKGRNYERVRCPGCSRMVGAYAPHGGDGSGLRVTPHNIRATGSDKQAAPACGVSDRLVVLDGQGGWKVDA